MVSARQARSLRGLPSRTRSAARGRAGAAVRADSSGFVGNHTRVVGRPTEKELLHQVVPAAAATHLDHVYLDLPDGLREHREFDSGPGLPGRLLQFVAVDVIDMRDVLAATHRAPVLGRVAVETRS